MTEQPGFLGFIQASFIQGEAFASSFILLRTSRRISNKYVPQKAAKVIKETNVKTIYKACMGVENQDCCWF